MSRVVCGWRQVISYFNILDLGRRHHTRKGIKSLCKNLATSPGPSSDLSHFNDFIKRNQTWQRECIGSSTSHVSGIDCMMMDARYCALFRIPIAGKLCSKMMRHFRHSGISTCEISCDVWNGRKASGSLTLCLFFLLPLCIFFFILFRLPPIYLLFSSRFPNDVLLIQQSIEQINFIYLKINVNRENGTREELKSRARLKAWVPWRRFAYSMRNVIFTQQWELTKERLYRWLCTFSYSKKFLNVFEWVSLQTLEGHPDPKRGEWRSAPLGIS